MLDLNMLEHTLKLADPSQQKRYAVLKGQSVAGAAYLAKPVNAAYFIFSDLSVQNEGLYRLKFQLFEQPRDAVDWTPDRAHRVALARKDLGAPDEEEAMELMTHVYSKPFQVYSAKKFPGLAPSTELSKCIAEQGCRVRIRRDIRQRKEGKDKKDDAFSGPSAQPSQMQTPSPYTSHVVHDQYRSNSFDMRRPSIDSQATTPHQYGPPRHPSYSSYSTLQSPTTIAANYYGAPQPPIQQRPVYKTEPEDFYRSNVPPRPQLHMQMPPAPAAYHQDSVYSATPTPQLTHAPPVAPRTPSVSYSGGKLPGISALLNQEPATMPPRPEGLYETTPMSGGKRGYSESREERENPAQERTRPKLTPSLRGGSGMSQPPPQESFYRPRHVLAGSATTIEADDDDEDDSEEEEYNANIKNYYTRADGNKILIAHTPMSFAQ